MKRVIALVVLLFLFAVVGSRSFGTDGSDESAIASPSASLSPSVGSTLHVSASEVFSTDTPWAVIVLRAGDSDAASFRVVSTADGKTIKELPAAPDVFAGDYPRVSPDGSWVYFTSGANTDGSHDIMRQSLQDAHIETVVTDAQQPALSPDGSYLAFGRKGVVTVRSLATMADSTFNQDDLGNGAEGNVLAGVRSIAWLGNVRLAALVSVDFQQFRIVVGEVSSNGLRVNTVRDAPRGQVVGPGTKADAVTVVDDMTKGLLVQSVSITGPAAVRQRSLTDATVTAWDISNDGKQLLVSDGGEIRRQGIEDPDAKTVLATDGFSAGF